MHTKVVIDPLSIDDYLTPAKKGAVANAKQWFVNWNSEFNIKKKVRLEESDEV